MKRLAIWLLALAAAFGSVLVPHGDVRAFGPQPPVVVGNIPFEALQTPQSLTSQGPGGTTHWTCPFPAPPPPTYGARCPAPPCGPPAPDGTFEVTVYPSFDNLGGGNWIASFPDPYRAGTDLTAQLADAQAKPDAINIYYGRYYPKAYTGVWGYVLRSGAVVPGSGTPGSLTPGQLALAGAVQVAENICGGYDFVGQGQTQCFTFNGLRECGNWPTVINQASAPLTCPQPAPSACPVDTTNPPIDLKANIIAQYDPGTIQTSPATAVQTYVDIPTCAWIAPAAANPLPPDPFVLNYKTQTQQVKIPKGTETVYLYYWLSVTRDPIRWTWGDEAQTTDPNGVNTGAGHPVVNYPTYSYLNQTWDSAGCTGGPIHHYDRVSAGRTITASQVFHESVFVTWTLGDGIAHSQTLVDARPLVVTWKPVTKPVYQIEGVPVSPK